MIWHRIPCVLVLSLAGIVGAATAEDSPWGILEGRFQIDRFIAIPPVLKAGNAQVKGNNFCGKIDIPDESLVVNAENLGIGNILIFLQKAPEQIHPDLVDVKEPALLKCENCRFVPHVMAIRAGQPLHVQMNDKVAHTAHFNPVKNDHVGIIFQPGDEPDNMRTTTFNLPESLPLKTTCDIHPWMNSYLTVLDHPYCAITDKDGKFRLEKLPAGPHTFRVWHERCGYVIREWKVTVEPGQTTTMPVEKVTAEKLKVKTAPE